MTIKAAQCIYILKVISTIFAEAEDDIFGEIHLVYDNMHVRPAFQGGNYWAVLIRNCNEGTTAS